jgi:hypothetical protein
MFSHIIHKMIGEEGDPYESLLSIYIILNFANIA